MGHPGDAQEAGRGLRRVAAALRDLLLPLATVITPNLPEAADLLGRSEAQSRDDMEDQATALLALGAKAVLLKGGHLPGDDSPDLFLSPSARVWIAAPRVATKNTHGTGCTLSSAIATGLGAGLDLVAAIEQARAFVRAALGAAPGFGAGSGPLGHQAVQSSS